ncbi:MAG: AraC family transcriptional regulator [Pirellulales bacterium]
MQLLSNLLDGTQSAKAQVMVAPPPVAVRESTSGSIGLDDNMRRAHQMIQELACQGLTVTQLLARLAISQKTLNKRFAAVYGRTPGEAIRQIRLERAKPWLTTTELFIGRIAEMCGFEEASNFNLFFKRETSCTPSQFRASHQEER